MGLTVVNSNVVGKIMTIIIGETISRDTMASRYVIN